LIVVKPLPGLISRSPTTMTNQLVTACGIWLIQSFLIYFLTGTLSKELTFLNYTDPGHVPCITRIWVQVETLLVFWTAEVHDHVSFGISHPGCVLTLCTHTAGTGIFPGWLEHEPAGPSPLSVYPDSESTGRDTSCLLHGWGEWPYLFWPFSSWLCSHNAGICSPVNWRRHSVPGPLAYMTRQRPFRCHFNMTHTYVSCESVKKGYQVLT